MWHLALFPLLYYLQAGIRVATHILFPFSSTDSVVPEAQTHSVINGLDYPDFGSNPAEQVTHLVKFSLLYLSQAEMI